MLPVTLGSPPVSPRLAGFMCRSVHAIAGLGQRDVRVAGLKLDAQFGQGLPRRECIGEESDEFRVTATCRQFGN
jgi:hypothetical protein